MDEGFSTRQGSNADNRRHACNVSLPCPHEFYKRALDARELYRSEMPGVGVLHVQLQIYESVVELSLENMGMSEEIFAPREKGLRTRAPHALNGTTSVLEIYVDDVDQAFALVKEVGGGSGIKRARSARHLRRFCDILSPWRPHFSFTHKQTTNSCAKWPNSSDSVVISPALLMAAYGDGGRFGSSVMSLYEYQGGLWAGAITGLWRWKPDPPQFYPMPKPIRQLHDLTEGDNGALWIATSEGIGRNLAMDWRKTEAASSTLPVLYLRGSSNPTRPTKAPRPTPAARAATVAIPRCSRPRDLCNLLIFKCRL